MSKSLSASRPGGRTLLDVESEAFAVVIAIFSRCISAVVEQPSGAVTDAALTPGKAAA